MISSREPTRRKIAELPYHLTNAEDWSRLEQTLCDLYFIEAKCAAGMNYELILDYETALDALPEAQEEKQKEGEREERVKKYTENMLVYAKTWNDARVQTCHRPRPQSNAEAGRYSASEPIPSVAPWSDDKIREDTERIVNNPNRRDRMKAFSQFVKSESHALVKFATLPGFCMQQAYNSANSGPVVSAAERIISTGRDNSLLLRHPSQRRSYAPHPACLMTLEGHKESITSVGITSGGKRAVSGSSDKTLRVWDLESGQCLKTLEGHTDDVRSVSITPDGKRAVSGSSDKTLRVWDLESGQCLRTLEGHTVMSEA